MRSTNLLKICALGTFFLAGCGIDETVSPQSHGFNGRGIVGGSVTSTATYPQFVLSGCTATVVGPRTVLSSAHCQTSQSIRFFTDRNGVRQRVRYINHPHYNGTSAAYDIALGITDQVIRKTRPKRVANRLTGGWHFVFGYGCGHEGGPWGSLRWGWAYHRSGNVNSPVLISRGNSVCGGDSGGAFMDLSNQILEGVISRGSPRHQDTHHANVAHPAVRNFILGRANANRVQVCGITAGGCQTTP